MDTTKEKDVSINSLISTEGCFDLQFRQDVKHNRPNSPTYYRWKVQFVITQGVKNKNILEEVKNILSCGRIHLIKERVRYSIQNLDEIKNTLIPYFKEHQLSEAKNKDFKLWAESVEIIYRNKGKILSTWRKEDFQQLIEIQEAMKKYKGKQKVAKWTKIAKDLVKTF